MHLATLTPVSLSKVPIGLAHVFDRRTRRAGGEAQEPCPESRVRDSRCRTRDCGDVELQLRLSPVCIRLRRFPSAQFWIFFDPEISLCHSV